MTRGGVPVGPLIRFLAMAEAEAAEVHPGHPDYADSGRAWIATGGRRELAERIAERYGEDPATVVRMLERLAAGQPTISPRTADRLAVFLNLHPALLWPERSA